MIYKLLKDELIATWHRHFFEVEAESLDEAINKIKDEEVEPYDCEFIPEECSTSVIEILDHEGNLLERL